MGKKYIQSNCSNVVKLSKSFFVKPVPKKVLLIDDDISFRLFMKSVTESESVKITTHNSLRDLASPRELMTYDLIILDYLMDRFNGLQTAKYIDTFFSSIPVILISSASYLVPNKTWPTCIKKFLGKEIGVYNMANEVQQFLNC